ncbi:MAG TPA: cupin-like domain-containing protein [Verrucomicrobiae bacterium]|nr:cupin-like domain-containing protein [Verrucomicrobiae bacterium]
MKLSPVERIHRPTMDEFQSNYFHKAPVILTGFTDNWVARKLWKPESMKQVFGHIVVPLRGSDNEFEVFFKNVGATSMTLGQYFDAIADPTRTGRPPFLGNISFDNPLTREHLKPLRSHFSFPKLFPGKDKQETRLWIGAFGQKSTIHNDNYDNLNAQVVGQKKFLLFSPDQHPLLYPKKLTDFCWASPVDRDNPDFENYPLSRELEGFECTLEPGDILYIPIFWWHQAISESLAINVNMWVYEDGEMTFWSEPELAATHA